MRKPWLHIIGIGEDGLEGLSNHAMDIVQKADVIIGGDRHHKLASNMTAKRLKWPSPFDAMIDVIQSYRGQRLVILVTGDPLWYSVGARIARAIPREDICFHPQLSAFQWAAVRMGWSLADCETLTIHGRADSQILPHLAPGVRLLVLTQNRHSPENVAQLLSVRGFGRSTITALASLGGADEQRFEGVAENWHHDVPDFHTLAIECMHDGHSPWFGRHGGLPDDAFISDGQMTKQDVRAITLAKLMPYPDALLWDIGAGCGSVAIEWMRAARGAMAVAVECNDERRQMIAENAVRLGAEKIKIIAGRAPDVLKNLENLQGLTQPDAIFLGGGVSDDAVFECAFKALRPGGRLVANGVTMQAEQKLAARFQRYGGDLVRLSVQKIHPIGQFHGWKAAMPVTQWSLQKQSEG